jgi:hypothetical protein
MLKYQDVFVPGGFPRHTYNPRVDLQLESRLGEVTNNLCKLVTVTGQTKSGKTVLARKVLPPEETIWIDGGTVSEEDDFWHVIIEQLELFQDTRQDNSSAVAGKIAGKAAASASLLVAKGQGEVGAEIQRTRTAGKSITRSVSSRVTALRGLRESRVPLVVDDFHYIPREMQGKIVRALKPLIFDGLPVVIIAIPHRRYDALKVEKEMTGRISPIDIPVWSEEELRYIPTTGFGLLNYILPKDISERLATQAIGSPHLMQDFCRGISKAMSVEQASRRKALPVTDTELDGVFRDVAETIGRPIFEQLARGPRSRTDRLNAKCRVVEQEIFTSSFSTRWRIYNRAW